MTAVGAELATVDAPVSLGVVRATTPAELVKSATEAANALAGVVENRKLYSKISGRTYVRCKGWTTLAAMLGVTPHEVQVTEVDGVFTAVVELRRITDGAAVGRASAECGAADELDRNHRPLWANRPRYARRSMALTRATAKACRLTFSWIMALAGYEVTPAEEVPSGSGADDDGVVLEIASDEQKKIVFADAAKAGLTKETFPQWYQEVLGKPFVNVYESDVPALLDAAAKRIAAKTPKTEPVAA